MSDVSEGAGLVDSGPAGATVATGINEAADGKTKTSWADNARASFESFVEAVTRPDLLLPNLTAAVLLAVMNITTAISVAALVFSGLLAGSFGSGIGLLLWGTAFGGVLIAAGSGYKAVLAGPRSGQAPIVAGMVAGIALTMERRCKTVVQF